MGKRSDFPRRARDYYPTPLKGAAPLIPFLARDNVTNFAEVCCGQGHLVRHLESAGLQCVYEGDIADGKDALSLTVADLNGGMPITNPPTKYAWENPKGSTCHLLCDLLRHFLALGVPAWWLIHHDFVTSLRAVPFLTHCSDIVAIPRMKWVEGTKHGAMDSFSWFRMDPNYRRNFTPIHHRGVSPIATGITCEACGRPFQHQRSTAKFCSVTCRQRAHRARPADSLSVTSVTGREA